MSIQKNNSYFSNIYAHQAQQENTIETHLCIKGIDYMNRPSWNQYSFVKDLGQGAYAKVILAQTNHNFQMFAIKQLKKSGLNKNAQSEFDLFREIDIQKSLNHPNIVKLYEIIDDEEDEKIHLILNYCKHGEILTFDEDKMKFTPNSALLQRKSLKNNLILNQEFVIEETKQLDVEEQVFQIQKGEIIIDNNYLTENQIRKLSKQIIEAVGHIHQKGYLHLDIKPQNILIDENLNAQIADFGSSWLFRDENDQISEVKGTSYFLAPESIKQSFGYYSGRKYDIWCVGMTIYSMTFNSLPYQVTQKGLSNITQAIKSFEIDYHTLTQKDQVQSQGSGLYEQKQERQISKGLANLLSKMLQKDPNLRATIEFIKMDEWLNKNDD